MIEFTNPITTDQMYGPWPIPDEDVNAALDRSRQPEPWTSLFDNVGDLGVGAKDVVLDIGARDAHHGLEIAARFGCTIIAVDPVDLNT